MQYADLNLIIGERQPKGYPLSAIGAGTGRASAVLPVPPVALTAALARATAPAASPESLTKAGSLLFDWAFPAPIRTHLRLAWDRAQRDGAGLRLRLSIDAPEIASLPWEFLHDPERGHTFAASAATPLVRYFEQTDRFGGASELATDLPINLLLVLPATPDLDLGQERRNIEQIALATEGALRARTLDTTVTRADLADALLMGDYTVVHFGGHGGFIEGHGYLGLNEPDGGPDWLDGEALARLASNYRSIKLMVLNACESGHADDGRAFSGLAPQMVCSGIPAVVAMQFPITDKAAATFAREFYKRLCVGDDAGQVDVAVAYARSMLTLLHPGDRSWAAPVLYTHARDGAIFTVPPRVRAGAALDPIVQRERLAALTASLAASLQADDDWQLAGIEALESWREMTQRADETYRAHLTHPRPEIRQAAQEGLGLVAQRLQALEGAIAARSGDR